MFPTKWFAGDAARQRSRRRTLRRSFTVEGLEGRQVLSTFTVSNVNDSGAGSLRQAILSSNSTPNSTANTISFDIGAGGPATILPLSALPTITQAVVIDGTTQPGSGSTPSIVLDGVDAGSGTLGLVVEASNSVLKGLVIDSFDGTGVVVSGGSGDVITDDYIGVTSAGNSAAGNAGDGIHVLSDAKGNVISDDVISGNAEHGISLDGGSQGNTIEGSKIGTDSTGTVAVGNGDSGVYIENSSNSNLIGGTSPGSGNVISGNLARGVHIDSGSEHNLVEGNLIGTDVTGTKALGNTDSGVLITDGANDNTIGGSSAADRNILSANSERGVHINDASGNLVEGNFIGTDITGTKALGNGVNAPPTSSCSGVLVDDGSENNVIGGTASGDGNVISANGYCGVHIVGSSDNLVEGNDIGTGVGGVGALGNTEVGVLIDSGSSSNTIGGKSASASNLIADNGMNGVELNAAGSGNLIEGDTIDGNTGDGVYVDDTSSTTVSNCVIDSNTGWGILISDSTGWILSGDSTANNGLGGVSE